MGFPAGFHAFHISTFLFNLAFVLAYIKYGICWLLSWFGLAEPLWPDSSTWQEFSEISSANVSDIITESLPVLKFRDFAERVCEMEKDVTCAVCLSSFDEDDEIREICNCRHTFHRECLDKWIDDRQQTCPLCRCFLLPHDTEEESSEQG